MRNGFTLAEMLGVIAIIGILAVVVVFTADRAITNSRIKTCLAQEENIIEGAKAYAVDHPEVLTSGSVTLATLQSAGFVESGLKNPMTNKVYETGTKVNITKVSGTSAKYNYVVAGTTACK